MNYELRITNKMKTYNSQFVIRNSLFVSLHQTTKKEMFMKIIEKDGKRLVFDVIRRKYVALTPEEQVRQYFVNYLISEKGFPKEMIANEVSIKLHNTFKRCDTVIYNADLTPLMIVEYKAPTIDITPMIFEQIVRYNMALHAQYLIVSNGMKHICCQINYESQQYVFLKEIPEYKEIKG